MIRTSGLQHVRQFTKRDPPSGIMNAIFGHCLGKYNRHNKRASHWSMSIRRMDLSGFCGAPSELVYLYNSNKHTNNNITAKNHVSMVTNTRRCSLNDRLMLPTQPAHALYKKGVMMKLNLISNSCVAVMLMIISIQLTQCNTRYPLVDVTLVGGFWAA